MVIFGLKDSKEFKRSVMSMKDAAKKGESSLQAALVAAQYQSQVQAPAYSPPDGSVVALREIAASVSHIERLLESIEKKTHKYEKLKQVETEE